MIAEDVLIFFNKQQGRRPKVIWGLLIGKMTVSSLYWGLSYQLLEYLNFWKHIDGSSFLHAVEQAVKQGYLIKKDDLLFLTELGEQFQGDLSNPVKNTGELKLDELITLFLLANQVLSEFSFSNNRYVPVSDNQQINFLIKRWFKELKQQTKDSKKVVQTYVSALSEVVENLEEVEADLLLNYLPNHVDPGMTVDQLAEGNGLTKFQVEFKLRVIFSKVIGISFNRKITPLTALFKELIKESALPNSSLESWKLIQQGKALEQVANIRHIKLNTVKEHVLMAAILNFDFPYNRFIKQIIKLEQDPNEWDFENVKNAFPRMDFFEFRLQQIKKIKELQNASNN